MANQQHRLGTVPEQLLPREIVGPIFSKAAESSAVMQRARQIPLALDAETTIPVPLDVPIADWISEGARKPIGTTGMDVRMMTGKKVACMVVCSEEVRRTNPAGLYEQLSNDLPTAIARAFDFATVHGKTVAGGPGPFNDYLAATTNRVTLGTSTKAEGGIYADFVKGSAHVLDEGFDYNGVVADPRLRPMLQLATDLNGRPIYVDTYQSGTGSTVNGATLNGDPISYSKGVSGKVNRQSTLTDTGLRAIGGDWSQVAYGVGMDITIKASTEATYVDEDGNAHSAFQENLCLILAEAYYGMIVGDADAFVAYDGVASGS